MIQKLFKVAFDSTVIKFDHSDHVRAKVYNFGYKSTFTMYVSETILENSTR